MAKRKVTPNQRDELSRLMALAIGEDQGGFKGLYHINAVDCVTYLSPMQTETLVIIGKGMFRTCENYIEVMRLAHKFAKAMDRQS